MEITNIIHQQIAQLKWHILACLGLVMVLPVENAIVNLLDGDGFYDDNMVYAGMLISILLSGLIAAANIQADFKESRYSFWRSKPINAKLFITLKYFTGLGISVFIIACPFLFGLITTSIQGEEFFQNDNVILSIMFACLALLAYTFCFASNVLVRKTARAWLIGVTLTCLTLLLPFILPFNNSLIENGHGGFFIRSLLLIIACSVVGAFIFSILAADRNWHLKTNLKGLLWVSAIFLFSLLMFFSTQVANIKVLDEIETDYVQYDCLADVDGKTILKYYGFVDISANRMSLQKFANLKFEPLKTTALGSDHEEFNKALDNEKYRRAWIYHDLSYEFSGEQYSLTMLSFYKPEKRPDGRETNRRHYKKMFIYRQKLTSDESGNLSVLDISEYFLKPSGDLDLSKETTMRRFDGRLILYHGTTMLQIDLNDPKQVRLANVSTVPKRRALLLADNGNEYKMPLLNIESLSPEESLRFSIDYNVSNTSISRRGLFDRSFVDSYDGGIVFVFQESDRYFRCKVTRWDDQHIYFRVTDVREFSILERTLNDDWHPNTFVKDGRLYTANQRELHVFDIRSSEKIRKLGHFIRAQTGINDVHVLDDGNILLALSAIESDRHQGALALLKKP